MQINTQKTVSFGEAFRLWLKLGFISFGGPAGQIAIMQRELFENKKWIDQEDFLHALNYFMLLPGSEAQQLATHIGWRLHGIKGGIAAGSLFVIPSIFFLSILSYNYVPYGSVPAVSAIFDGFKAVGVILSLALIFGAAVILPHLQLDIFGLGFTIFIFRRALFF